MDIPQRLDGGWGQWGSLCCPGHLGIGFLGADVDGDVSGAATFVSRCHSCVVFDEGGVVDDDIPLAGDLSSPVDVVEVEHLKEWAWQWRCRFLEDVFEIFVDRLMLGWVVESGQVHVNICILHHGGRIDQSTNKFPSGVSGGTCIE